MDLRSHLRAEYTGRRARNPSYSLRAFARALGVSHSTLSRLLRGGRRLTRSTLDRLAGGAGLSPLDAERAALHEAQGSILDLVRRPGFRADSRWLAAMTGLPVDEINVALHALLHARRLSFTAPHVWRPEND